MGGNQRRALGRGEQGWRCKPGRKPRIINKYWWRGEHPLLLEGSSTHLGPRRPYPRHRVGGSAAQSHALVHEISLERAHVIGHNAVAKPHLMFLRPLGCGDFWHLQDLRLSYLLIDLAWPPESGVFHSPGHSSSLHQVVGWCLQ